MSGLSIIFDEKKSRKIFYTEVENYLMQVILMLMKMYDNKVNTNFKEKKHPKEILVISVYH